MASNAMIGGSGFVTQPPDEMPMASQSTLLLQKKKEMAEVQQQLDRKKEEFRARMQRCQEKEVDLAARQEGIKEQVRKFDKFLKDNDAKRVRADRKVIEERKIAEQKEQERIKLLQVLQQEDEKRLALKGEVEAKGKFQRFLDSALEDATVSEYFEALENITMRYETLDAAHADLSERVSSGQTEVEDSNARLMGYIKQRTNDLLVYNSEVATKQTELDMMRLSMQDREAKLESTATSTKEGTRNLGEVKMAIENIYGRCAKAKSRGQHHDHFAFLEAIRERVTDLQVIIKEVRAAKREGAAAAADDDPAKSAKPADAARNGATAAATSDGKALRASVGPGGSTSLSASAAGASTTSMGGGGPLSKTIV